MIYSRLCWWITSLRTKRALYFNPLLSGRCSMSREAEVVTRSPSPNEVQFPVPWGHISGKAWGDPSGKPVLALHGWLDNAGSFDKLIPLLSEDLYIVAVDWPGHGHSSHRSQGSHYPAYDYIADIKYVVDALKWEKFTFLAHSMAAGVAPWFAGALPDRVQAMVLLEGIGFWTEPMDNLPTSMGRALNQLSTLDEKDNKVYSTWDAVVDRILEGHLKGDSEFDHEAAATLAIRGARQDSSGGYQFTRDLRLKSHSLLRACSEINEVFLKAVRCPLLVVMAERTFVRPEVINSRLKVVGTNPEKVKLVKVPGGHHVHLCRPEVVAKLVDRFLLAQMIHQDYQEVSRL